jgi:hypothetical protein
VRQDHTISPYAPAPRVLRHHASTATRPDVSDDGRRPLYWDGMAAITPVICCEKIPEYFFVWGWTGQANHSLAWPSSPG